MGQALDFLKLANFTPKQLIAWWKIHPGKGEGIRFLLYGGARGGGKSRFLRWALLGLLLYWGKVKKLKGVKVVLFAEDYPTLTDRQIGPMTDEFPAWLGELKRTQADGLGFHLRKEWGGGHLLLRNLGEDVSRYKSAEFAAIAIDELTFWEYGEFSVLRGSLRWPGIKSPIFLGGTNPGGKGHLWVKDLWIDKLLTRHAELEPIFATFDFVQSLPTDNPYLEKSYWDDLATLPEQLKRAWLHGDWTVFEGQVFTEWNPLVHTCDPFNIPEMWPKWRSVDPGYTAPACVLWYAIDPETGRLYIYREAYGPGQSDENMARIVAEHSKNEIYDKPSFADGALWVAYRSEKAGYTSGADVFASRGIILQPADKNRLNGKRKVHDVLGKLKDGGPGIVFFKTCVNLIRTLPALPYSKKAGKLEDVDTEAEDHAYDSLRYGLSRLAPESRRGDNDKVDPDTAKWARDAERLAQAFG
jgi:hypothetical protein